MPADLSQGFRRLLTICLVSPLKIRPSDGVPHSSSAWSLIGMVASVSVFSVLIRMHFPPPG